MLGEAAICCNGAAGFLAGRRRAQDRPPSVVVKVWPSADETVAVCASVACTADRFVNSGNGMRSNARPSVSARPCRRRPTIEKAVAVGAAPAVHSASRPVGTAVHDCRRRPTSRRCGRRRRQRTERIRRADLVASERRGLDDLAHATLVSRGGRRGVGCVGGGGAAAATSLAGLAVPAGGAGDEPARPAAASSPRAWRPDRRLSPCSTFRASAFLSSTGGVSASAFFASAQLRVIRRGDRARRLRDLRRLSRHHDHDHEDGSGRGDRDHPHPPRPAWGGLHDFRRRRRGRGLGESALGSHEGGHQRRTRGIGDVRSRARADPGSLPSSHAAAVSASSSRRPSPAPCPG